MKKLLFGFAALAVLSLVAAPTAEETFISDLLAKMTLDEKVGQTIQTSAQLSTGALAQDGSGRPVDESFLARVRRGEIGSILGAAGVRNYNALQKAATESRLGIPLTVGNDMIHGCLTQFPIPLGLSAAWDETAWYRVGEVIARETPLKGCNWTFAPMVDIARDARWGRIAESAGQDPLVASLYSAAMVKGIQSAPVKGGTFIAACLKHFVGYGAASGGRDYNEVEMSEGTLRDIYLPPFKAGIDAGALSVMPAFHAFNGIPCSMNKFLLTDVLRRDLGFVGMTISDWGAVDECSKIGHGLSSSDDRTAAMAVNAGMDQEMMRGAYERGLKTAVKRGLVSQEMLNTRVANILRMKYRMGLFTNPYIDEAANRTGVDGERFLKDARDIARKTIVLLKNEGVLPLKKGVKIALIGDLAANANEMRGTWSVYFENVRNASLLVGLKAVGTDVTYAKCYSITGSCNREAIRAAVKDADVVVAAFGEYFEMNGENNSKVDLRLMGEQLVAAQTVKDCGKPLVAVLFNGRPMAIPELAETADALVEAWNPGSCGGWAVADVLTGAYNPSARLTVDFPRATGQCPIYYNRTSTGRPHKPGERWVTRYMDAPLSPLFPFGFGLSYTTYAYANERVEKTAEGYRFLADVSNTGAVEGVETVQLYLHQQEAMAVRPVRELKGFARVSLRPGETKTVEILMKKEALAYHIGSEKFLENGIYDWWIAPDSVSGTRHELLVD